MKSLLQDSAAEQGFLDQLQEFLSPGLLSSWEFWAILSAVLLIGEVMTASFLLGAFLPGTILAGLLAGFGWGLPVQLAGFTLGTLVGLALLRPMLLRRLEAAAQSTNVDALVGQTGRVTEELLLHETGRVKVSNEEWRARAAQAIPVGTEVRVLSVSGNTLDVRPVED